MINVFEGAISDGAVEFLDATEEEITCFVGDMLRQISTLIEFTAIPSDRKSALRTAIEAIDTSQSRQGADAATCDWQH